MPVIQADYASGVTSAAPVLAGVSAGNMLVLAYAQSANGGNSYTASSSLDGALTSVVAYNPLGASGPRVGFFKLEAASAGTHTVTITCATGSLSVHAWLFEAAGIDVVASAVTPTGGGNQDSAADAHYCAPSGEIDVTDPALIFCVGTVSGGVTTLGAGSGYTYAEPASSARAVVQYMETTGAVANERGNWVTTGVDRTATSTMVAFPLSNTSGGVNRGWWVSIL